ncbi:MAG: HAMP domain-containing histidine kinase [Gemmatimonadaceae bacterium]|nr:HAMP domain-containing histidine kinase [Gemmatimonadaceae bacterium]HPV73880.1 HAMP domain-containing sensor histidine kinase [Gemmatimonadaceae bacterium]
MTAWYAGSVFVLLLLSVIAMRGIARRALAVQHEDAVQRNIDLVRSFFRAELSEYHQVDATLLHIAGELVFAGMGLEFLRPDSSNFAQARLPSARAMPRPPVRTYVAALEPALAPGWKLRLRVSVADLAMAQRRIDQATLVALPLAVALAALAGWLVTGRALRPVGMMAAAAEQIDATSPTGRLPIADEHDELGRLGRRFNALLDRLDSALAQQRRFLADAAHELRTPMARMLGESETRLALPPSPDDRQSVERIHEDLRHASSLVDELMQLARADAGSVDAVLQPCYLDDVVSDALSPWHAEARRRGITLEVAALDEAPARLDVRLTGRMLGVLLHNALHYTPSGGRIEVRVSSDKGHAILDVDDSGIGIPPAEREHVFERFFRGEAARQRAPEGSGLGLAIAQWIAHQHGARISVGESVLGGARFRVSFPAGAAV